MKRVVFSVLYLWNLSDLWFQEHTLRGVGTDSSHARDSRPQHSTSVMAPLTPGVAYRRSPPRKPEFPIFPPPGRAKLPLSRNANCVLSRQPNRQPRASPRPNLARGSSPSGTTRRKSCDGAPQLAQGTALKFVGYQEFGCTAFQLRMVFTQGATESQSGVCMTSTPTSILLPSP
jgi:hypothetical protein